MVLKVLGSSSKGNCYLLQASDGVLMIEAGIPMIEVKKALEWRLNGVLGCLISHSHRDHSKFLKEALSCGIRVMALEDVFISHNLSNRAFCKSIEPMRGYKVGGFKIFALPVVHDVPCLGFIVEHQEMGKLLFITDTMMLEYKLPKLDHIMLETNYSDKILEENIRTGIVPLSMKERLLHSHMELQTTKEILRCNDISDTKEVILLHLSDNNSDAKQFEEEVGTITGGAVYIARQGLEIELSKDPY